MAMHRSTPWSASRSSSRSSGGTEARAGGDAHHLDVTVNVGGGGDAQATVQEIGRVLVAASHRGRGLAEVLMSRALELVGDRDSALDAQSYLATWYERFGYEVTGPEFLDDGIPHVPMRRTARR